MIPLRAEPYTFCLWNYLQKEGWNDLHPHLLTIGLEIIESSKLISLKL
jgi:hypothetical protein